MAGRGNHSPTSISSGNLPRENAKKGPTFFSFQKHLPVESSLSHEWQAWAPAFHWRRRLVHQDLSSGSWGGRRSRDAIQAAPCTIARETEAQAGGCCDGGGSALLSMCYRVGRLLGSSLWPQQPHPLLTEQWSLGVRGPCLLPRPTTDTPSQ